MIINGDTKIAAILKHHNAALDAIVSLSPRFEKLRNPLMRRLMAGRTSLAMAAKLGGCSVLDFYEKLIPLGFAVDHSVAAGSDEEKQMPAFLASLKQEQVISMDVRPILSSGEDPLQQIMQKIKSVEPGQALKIINTFEPTPLILLLQKKGFETFTDEIAADHFETYFYKATASSAEEQLPAPDMADWDKLIVQHDGKMKSIDVRHLEMPQPMMTILEELDNLESGSALYVHHKKIPLFLLPELKDRGFEYRIKQISESEVDLLIFK